MVKWLTTRRDRESRKFKELHRELARDIAAKQIDSEPDKRARKRAASEDFRAGRS